MQTFRITVQKIETYRATVTVDCELQRDAEIAALKKVKDLEFKGWGFEKPPQYSFFQIETQEKK